MTFPAHYPGRCAACDERIHVGDDIRMTDDDGAVHADCDDTTPTRPEPDPCPRCWLIHAGECDR